MEFKERNLITRIWIFYHPQSTVLELKRFHLTGEDPGSFLGGGALVSCSTSTPINNIVFFAEYQLN